MKKRDVLAFILVIALILPLASASLQINKEDKGSVVISELDNPAVFNFTVDSPLNETIELYSFVGISFSPKGAFEISSGKNNFEVRAYPNKEIRQQKGVYIFEYYIKGQYSGITKDTLTITIVPLKDTLEVKSQNLVLGDKEAVVSVKSLQNTNLDNLKIRFVSNFFDSEKTLSLKPYSSVKIPLKVDQDKLKTTLAGPYIFSAETSLGGASTKIDGVINYLESENTSLRESTDGIIVRKTSLTRTNNGNVPVIGKIEITRDTLSRLFTVHSLEPSEVDRNGLYVTYRWEKDLGPGESLTVDTTTNYTFPFVLILLIVVIAFLTKAYTNTALTAHKRVSFVKTRGGEFALKVRLSVKAKKYVENIQVIDRLPGMTQLYEKFGIKPDKIDAQSRRLFWNIDRLNAGEERVFSYVIYSKVKVVGRFELPPAAAVFQRDGKTEQVESNRTFFASETIRGDLD